MYLFLTFLLLYLIDIHNLFYSLLVFVILIVFRLSACQFLIKFHCGKRKYIYILFLI